MAITMHVDIVSAEEAIYSGPAEMLVASAENGDIGILPHHSPLLTMLKPGEVRVVKIGGEPEYYYVSGGMLEVLPHTVTVLADTAMRADSVDEAAAIRAKNEAQQALKDYSSAVDYARAQAELAEAVGQLQTIQRMRKKYGR